MRLKDTNKRSSFNDLEIQKTVQEQKNKELMDRNKKRQMQRNQEMKNLMKKLKLMKKK